MNIVECAAGESSTRAHRRGWARAWLASTLALVAVALGAGYHFGVHAGRTVTVRSGVAWSSGQQASVTSRGRVYNVPLGIDSDWYSGGIENQGTTPACLPPLHKVTITFGTVSFSQDGALTSQVVWVRC